MENSRYLNRNSASVKGIGNTGRKVERNLAKGLGGRLTPASGASHSKGDLKVGAFLVESKATEQRSISMKLDWLQKIQAEATAVGREAALAVSFTTSTGTPVEHGEWVAIPLRLFKELLEAQE